MITKLIAFVFLSLINFKAFPQSNAEDKIIGVWLNEEKDAEIEIYKIGNKYFGKIVGGKNLREKDGKTLLNDVKNPDSKQRIKPLLQQVILTEFTFQDGEWTNGKIYDPKSGKTYSSTIKLKGNRLELRGYVGISLFGRTTVWTRED